MSLGVLVLISLVVIMWVVLNIFLVTSVLYIVCII